MPKVEFPCDQDGVLKLLPHRDPFVWVNRIDICTPGEYILAELDVDPNLPVFQGHFPGHPIFPGVLVMEALAQAACCCIMSDPSRETAIGYLAGIDGAKFREPTLPGDTLELEAEIISSNKRFCKAHVKARKGDKVVAEAIQRYIIATNEERDDIVEDAVETMAEAKRRDSAPISADVLFAKVNGKIS